MRPPAEDALSSQKPILIDRAKELDSYLKTLSSQQLAKVMHISPKLAESTHNLIAGWTDAPSSQRPAIDSFLGDIYSGLQVLDWTEKDREYANQRLKILSGLYGILKPLDGIYPYRLEMGYRLPLKKFSNLEKYWSQDILATLPTNQLIVNLAAVEYSKVILGHIDNAQVISPMFLTLNPKTNQPTFVVVHAKIARGAFARYLIKNRVNEQKQLRDFADLGYKYNQVLSSPNIPVFVCNIFGGIGLSVRLK